MRRGASVVWLRYRLHRGSWSACDPAQRCRSLQLEGRITFPPSFKIDPTVAWVAADSITLAIKAFIIEFKRLNWLIDDLGFTTGVTFNALKHSYRRISTKPSRTANCPCGSGRPFGDCQHKWGKSAVPPTSGAQFSFDGTIARN
jgi:hypothetical protein